MPKRSAEEIQCKHCNGSGQCNCSTCGGTCAWCVGGLSLMRRANRVHGKVTLELTNSLANPQPK